MTPLQRLVLNMSMNSIVDVLIEAVRESFGIQLQRGYRIAKETIIDTPTQVALELVGANVALRFSVDRREGIVDLYVAKVIDGRAAERGSGQYFNSLTGYLREKGVFWETRDIRSDVDYPLEHKIRADVREYADVINNLAISIATDTELFT